MASIFARVQTFAVSHLVALLRIAGAVAIASGLVGGFVWLVALADRSDGDDLRWGFFHNPFMQFYPFNEPFLDVSMWVLLACSAAAGLGGLVLLIPRRWGLPLVLWQARIAMVTNVVIAVFIVATMLSFPKYLLDGTGEALALRLGSVAVDLGLWAILGSKVVTEFRDCPSGQGARGFDVLINES